MTEATYKRKHLIRDLLTVSEGESMIIMVESMAVGRQEGRGWSSSRELTSYPKREAEGE